MNGLPDGPAPAEYGVRARLEGPGPSSSRPRRSILRDAEPCRRALYWLPTGSLLAPSGSSRLHLATSGSIWLHLASSGSIWLHLAPSDPSWPALRGSASLRLGTKRPRRSGPLALTRALTPMSQRVPVRVHPSVLATPGSREETQERLYFILLGPASWTS